MLNIFNICNMYVLNIKIVLNGIIKSFVQFCFVKSYSFVYLYKLVVNECNSVHFCSSSESINLSLIEICSQLHL